MATNFNKIPALWNGSQDRHLPVRRSPHNLETQSILHSADLSSILYEFSPFPPYSMVIGQCMDGLPFMLSLDNPRSGSILVVGDHDWSKMQILHAMSVSACRINHPGDVSWSLITKTPRQYAELVSSQHCQAVINPHDRAAGKMVVELASTVEQRRHGREHGSMHVLMIDNFKSFAPMLSDYSVCLNFKTLVSKGPGCGIWPLVSINSEDAHTEQGQLLRTFGTYIFEKAEHENREINSTSQGYSPAPAFQPNFNVIVGGRLIPISSLSV